MAVGRKDARERPTKPVSSAGTGGRRSRNRADGSFSTELPSISAVARPITIVGTVSARATGQAAAGAVVNAYWPTEDGAVLAGSTVSNDRGEYRLRILVGQLNEERQDELTLRVERSGQALAESSVRVPRRKATANLTVDLDGTGGLEATRLALKLRDHDVTGVRASELKSLASELGETSRNVRMFASATRLARATGAPTEMLYALLRDGQPASLSNLSAVSAPAIRKALKSSVKRSIVPEPSEADIAALLGALRTERSDRTPALELLDGAGGAVPSSIRKALARRKIETLADLRDVGGLSHALRPSAATNDLVARVDAHARLSVIEGDVAVRKKLIKSGFTGLSAIARTDGAAFAKAVHGSIDDEDARALHRRAEVGVAVAKNAMAAARVSNGDRTPSELRDGLPHERPTLIPCKCDDCASAVGPLAYLADLMAYVNDNVIDTAKLNLRIDWRFLEKHFRQPFGQLAVSCEAVDAPVRQVRICVEVLRDYFADNPPTAAQAAALEQAERDYLREVYQRLLTLAGTSLDELRLIQHADADARKAFAERIGVSPPTPTVDRLRELLIDTEPPRLVADIEADLETVFGIGDTQKPPLHLIPAAKLLEWRRAHLRELWQAQDWPDDLPAEGRPIVDPDLIGPDDFRQPTSTDEPFKLWLKRRTWVDDRLADFQQIAAAQPASVDALLDAMYQAHTYPLTPTSDASAKWPTPKKELGEIHEALRAGGLDKDAVAQTLIRLSTKYGLSAERLNRLIELRDKAVAAADPRNAKLDEGEWSEVYSILVQSLKELLFADWRKEETDEQIEFGPGEFWVSLREPVEGSWPPPTLGVPLIDPEKSRLTDLPDSAVGDEARTLYQARRTELAQDYSDLKHARESASHGFEKMLKQALGDPLPLDLDQTLADLSSSDTTVSGPAEVAVETQLHLGVEDFRRLMTIRAKDAETDPYRKPTTSEYADVYGLLVTSEKQRVRYPTWRTEEAQANLEYWQARKASLPRWRGSVEARHDWQRTLRIRSSPPLIDPDLIAKEYLPPPITSQPPWSLWSQRSTAIQNFRHNLETQVKGAASPAAGLDAIISSVLGTSRQDLLAVEDASTRGESIARRLDQLGLSQPAFDELISVARLLAANEAVLPTEWDAVFDILVQVWKSRSRLAWRDEERNTLTLGPDFFRFPPVDPQQFPPPPPPELPRWRASLDALLDWEDRLRSRIEFDDSLSSALNQMIATAEETSLPHLRTALIAAARLPSAAQPDRPEWLSDLLLIDMKCGGCTTTTRVAQAIETIQSLLFLLRSGELREVEDFKTIALRDAALATFDDDMAWMGSYSTWRAAMFVFLYPENILLPSLRTETTPAFFDLVDGLRTLSPVSPKQATAAAHGYQEYFRDICSLELPWAVFGDISHDLDEIRPQAPPTEARLFLFSRSATGKVYWCTRAQSKSPDTQTFWAEVPGLASVTGIVGAVRYNPSPSVRYLFLFVQTVELGQPKLVFVQYDLERRIWAGSEPTELPLAEDRPFPKTIQLLQTAPIDPPEIYVKFDDDSDGTRSLNQLGKQWEKADFTPVNKKEQLAQRVDASRHKAGLDDEPISESEPWPGFDTIMKWLVAANDFAIGSNPPYACGVPDFTQSGDRFGVIGMDKALVDIRSANEVWPTSPIPKIATFAELTTLWDNAGGAAAALREAYLAAFPLFTQEGSSWIAETVACIKPVTGVSLVPASFNSFQTKLAAPPRNLYPADLDPIFAGALGLTLPFPFFVGADFAGRFAWADVQAKASGTNFCAFPAFSDRGAGLNATQDSACVIPPEQQVVRTIPSRAVSEPLLDAWRPSFGGNLAITPRAIGAGAGLQARRLEEASAFTTNSGLPASMLTYFDEAWYFVPMHIGLQLQSSGNFREALDWFRTVYDYSAQLGERKIAELLVREESAGAGFHRDALSQWLRDPLNPHRIAKTRANTYTRFTLLAIIRCLLDYAESEYTRDTPESVPRARLLFESALRLLDDRELTQSYRTACDALVGDLEIKYGDEYTELADGSEVGDWMETLSLDAVMRIVPATETILTNKTTSEEKVKAFTALVAKETKADEKMRPSNVSELLAAEATAGDEELDAIAMQPDLTDGLRRMNGSSSSPDDLEYAMDSPTRPIAHIPAALITACIPPNPMLRALRLRAEANLYKIRTCRSIAGLQRALDAYAAPTDTVTGLPSIGAGGQLVVPGLATPRPTPYRFATLIERAKQMVQLAQQVETAMFSAIQQADAEAYTVLRARQDVQHSLAGVTLQDLRLTEAQDQVDLAALQRDRANIQAQTYEEWLGMGLNTWEQVMVGAYIVAAVNQAIAAATSPWVNVDKPWQAGLAGVTSAAGSIAATAQGVATVASVYANLERRKQEWELSRDVAREDVAIGNQQLGIARDGVRVTTQERVIAQLEADNASRTVDFLSTKFTNVELYDWMAGVLQGVYRYFLQQATSVAQLAQSQLAFERQETAPPFIQADYWEPPSQSSGSDAQQPDRRGLTGSARLLEDIYRLDQYWFDTNKRKLQLTKTISLAQLAPVELQQFRETGVITFATPMELFDRDFPGHYLRLIRRVRMSVIALVPVTAGIKATLTSSRLSRTVLGGDLFQTVRVQHGPDSVALTSPLNATGLFELDQQPEMLMPFEGIGVDTLWELRMPRAANSFDYGTLADVILSIDYTALDSVDYRAEVTQRLGRTTSADRAYCFRTDFADAWYDLHNPDTTTTPMTVTFRIEESDFPPNCNDVRIAHVALFFARSDRISSVEVPVSSLALAPDGSSGKVGGGGTTNDGLLSTRRGNAGSWMAMIGQSPVGMWELSLPDTASLRKLFSDDEIDDIVLVVTYAGRLPVWPP
jgi:hypothetical protein